MCEGGLFHRVFVVRADPEASVEIAMEVQLDRRSHLVQRLAVRAQEKRDGVAALFQPHPLRCADVEGDVLRGVALVAPVLQRCFTGPMNRCVGVHSIGVERLPEHQQRLAMRARSWAGVGQLHIGGKRNVARDLLPHEVESIHVDPQICSR